MPLLPTVTAGTPWGVQGTDVGPGRSGRLSRVHQPAQNLHWGADQSLPPPRHSADAEAQVGLEGPQQDRHRGGADATAPDARPAATPPERQLRARPGWEGAPRTRTPPWGRLHAPRS